MKRIRLLLAEKYTLAFTLLMCVAAAVGSYRSNREIDEIIFTGLLYCIVANVWMAFFAAKKPYFDKQRNLTAKERLILIIIALAAECAYLAVRLYFAGISGLMSLVSALIVVSDVLFVVFYISAKNRTTDPCEDDSGEEKYVFKSEEDVIADFNVGTTWYTKKRYRIMRDTYIEIAREYSGKKTYDEIEDMVCSMIAYKLREKSSKAIYFALLAFPLLSITQSDSLKDTVWYSIGSYIAIAAGFANIYGVFNAIATLHDPFTPNESKGYKKRTGKSLKKENGKEPPETYNPYVADGKIEKREEPKSKITAKATKKVFLSEIFDREAKVYKYENESKKVGKSIKHLIISTLVFLAFSGLFLALTINASLLFLTGVLVPLFFYLLFVSFIVDEIKAAKKPFVPLKPRDLEVLKKELEEKNEEYFEDEYGEHKEYTLIFDGFRTEAAEKVYAESEIGDVFVLVKNKRTSKVIGAYSERKFEFIDDLLRG